MRVHFFIPSLDASGGGSHQNAMILVRALRKRGHEVNVHTMFTEGAKPPEDISVHAERGEGYSFFAYQGFVAAALKRCQAEADIFFLYGQSLIWAGGMYRLSGGRKPVIAYIDSHLDSMKEAYRGIGFFRRLKHLLWDKTYGLLLAYCVDAYAAVSPYLSERYARFGFPKTAFTVIPNAFAFTANPSTTSPVRGGPLRCLHVGRLSYEKGPDVLLNALSGLPAGSWRLRMIGDGPERASLEGMLRSLDIEKSVEIVPWMPQAALAGEYRSVDVLVVPSRVPEPFGRVIVEAMHAGLPVVVPNAGGARWVAGDAGAVFQIGDSVSLRRALETLNDPELRRALGKNGEMRADQFSDTKVGEMLGQELLTLAREGKTAPSLPAFIAGALRVVRFIIAGGIATTANLLTLYLLVEAGLWYLPSSIIAFFVGFIASFTLQKFWTFGDSGMEQIRKQAAIYLTIVLVNLGINTALVYVFVEFARISPLLAQAASALIIAAEGYFAYGFFVFRSHAQELKDY